MHVAGRRGRVIAAALLIAVLALTAWTLVTHIMWPFAVAAVVTWLAVALRPPRVGVLRWPLLAGAAGLLLWYLLATPHRPVLVFLGGFLLAFVGVLDANQPDAASTEPQPLGETTGRGDGSA